MINALSFLASLPAKALPLIYAIIGFWTLIIVHELGHFLFCKLFGIHTPTFSIGMGPAIVEKKIGATNFRLASIPLGGYVEIAGLAEVGQGDQAHSQVRDETAFSSKRYWQRMLVLLGGIIFNLLFAYAAFITLYVVGKPRPYLGISIVNDGSLAEQAGIQKGDLIISMGGTNIAEDPARFEEEAKRLHTLANVDYPIVIKRAEEHKTLSIRLDTPDEQATKGRLGIGIAPQASNEYESYSLIQAIPRGIKLTNTWIVRTIQGIYALITLKTLRGAGPVMIISMSAQQAQQGFVHLLLFLAIISINLAVFNLFPIPALDGGQMLFTTIEAILGREINIETRNIIMIASWLLLLSLFLIFTYNDIRTLLGF